VTLHSLDKSSRGHLRRAGEQFTSDSESSSLDSLPLVEAFPETTHRYPLAAVATSVEFVKEPKRFEQDDDSDNDQMEARRPALICFRFRKESVDQPLGLDFRSAKGGLVFSSLSDANHFADSPIRVGDRLTSLDRHQAVTHWSAAQLADYLRTREGCITMMVETNNGDSNIVEACVYKSTAEQKLGITFLNNRGQLRILEVDRSGLLGGMSILHSGDCMESINSLQSLDANAAHDLLTSCVGRVSLRIKRENISEVSLRDATLSDDGSCTMHSENVIAADELELMESGDWIPDDDASRLPRPRFISVAVYEPTSETRHGIMFANPTGTKLIISRIENQSLLDRTPLKADYVVHSINGTKTKDLPVSVVVDTFRSVPDKIHVCAEDPMGEVSHAVATVVKPTPQAKLGISFGLTEGQLMVHDIGTDGLFANSVLNSNDKVIAINRIPCENMQLREAVRITQGNLASVTILVRRHPSNGIVVSREK